VFPVFEEEGEVCGVDGVFCLLFSGKLLYRYALE